MAAASAPAKPAAPTTATLWLGTQPPPDLAQRRLDGGPPRGHLLVGERAVGSAELEAKGQGAVALSHLLAGVDVEHTRASEQLTAAGADGRLHRGGAQAERGYHGDVLEHRRVGHHVLEGRDVTRGLIERIHVQLEHRGTLQVPRAGNQRMQLADPPDVRSPGYDPPAAPRVKERLGMALYLVRHPCRAEQSIHKGARGEEVGGRGLAPPRGRQGLREQAADVVALPCRGCTLRTPRGCV